MLELASFTVHIGATPIVREASMVLRGGEFCGLIGVNGAGKTTFMRGLMGALRVEGIARFDGEDLAAMPAHRRSHLGIGHMPEDRRLVPQFTAEENMLLPAWSGGASDTAARLAWIYRLMPEAEQFRERRAPSLSGGQQKMVALGRALMAGRRLLLLDEPFEGLAPALARRLVEVLSGLRSEGVGVLIADSNEKHAAALLDRAYRIERGVLTAA
jgi:branched-chain amino acid transport system ATP-binding protein